MRTSTPSPTRRRRPLSGEGAGPHRRSAPGSAAAVFAAGIIALFVLAAVAGPVLRPDVATNLTRVLAAPSGAHPLGTDATGRDLVALLVHAMRTSFLVSGVAATVALVVGTTVGAVAGLAGGWADAALMRAVDFFASQNHLLFGLLIAVLARPVLGGAGAVLLSVGLTHWMLLARILRAEAMSLRQRPFVLAAINGGVSRMHLAVRHLLPHLAPAAGVGFVLLFPHAIFHETALSFLGVGLPPEQPSLGTLIAAGQRSLFAGAWWVMLFPGLVIVVAAMAVGTLGEWLRDRSQPRWRAELEL